jgi:uncharacterized protein (DUF488 family)
MAYIGGLMETAQPIAISTIGHSTHPYARFLLLLRQAGVTAIADVRTSPFSRHFPQFNRDTLRDELRRDGISYVFLGKELGGRPNNEKFFHDGVADYEKMATTEEFAKGLARVIDGAKKYHIALMCSEHDPMDCHRCLLVGRALAQQEIAVKHISSDGKYATQSEIEERLLELAGRNSDDFFAPREERLNVAYRDRARKVAFAEPQQDPKGPIAAE